MIKFGSLFVKNYFKYGVSRSSASLAYYLMFSFFPLLIFLNSILGIINISPSQIQVFISIFPQDVQKVIFDYLEYLSHTDNVIPLILGLGLTLYSFTRCVNSLYHTINEIFGVLNPKKSMLKSFFFTFGLMISVYLMLFLVVSGGLILSFVLKFVTFSHDFIKIINTTRYLVAVSYFFFILMLMYKLIPTRKLKYIQVLPGALYAILGLFIISIGFSFYVANFSNYSLIYGSLSTIMILMLWLYISAMIIIQGAILNKILIDKEK